MNYVPTYSMMHSIKHRFAACALLCLLAVTAKAQIVYFGTPVTFSPTPASGAWTRYQFSFSTGTYNSYGESDDANTPILVSGSQLFRFTIFNNSTDGNRTGVQLEYGSTGTKVVASGGNLTNLSLAASVNSGTATTDAGSGPYINWTDGESTNGVFAASTPGYMGFSFVSGVNTYYGWAKITVASDTVGLTINEWAYNSTPGAAISVGAGASAIPEPSTYAALAGLVVLGTTVVVRRRRVAAATAA